MVKEAKEQERRFFEVFRVFRGFLEFCCFPLFCPLEVYGVLLFSVVLPFGGIFGSMHKGIFNNIGFFDQRRLCLCGHLPRLGSKAHYRVLLTSSVMTRIARQRLGMVIGAVLDFLALALFFVQTAIGDADWIRDEFVDYQFWSSVSDLGVRSKCRFTMPLVVSAAVCSKCGLTLFGFALPKILNFVKGVVLVIVYVVAGLTHLGPCFVR